MEDSLDTEYTALLILKAIAVNLDRVVASIEKKADTLSAKERDRIGRAYIKGYVDGAKSALMTVTINREKLDISKLLTGLDQAYTQAAAEVGYCPGSPTIYPSDGSTPFTPDERAEG